MSAATSESTWAAKSAARRAEIRANFNKPAEPEWVQRVKAQQRARREAAKLVLPVLELSPQELIEEHTGRRTA